MVRAFAICVAACHLLQLISLIDSYTATDRSKRKPWVPLGMAFDFLLFTWAVLVVWKHDG